MAIRLKGSKRRSSTKKRRTRKSTNKKTSFSLPKTSNDFNKLGHTGLIRFVMDGCHFCTESQPAFNEACNKMSTNPGCFLAQLEQSNMSAFQNSHFGLSTPPIDGFPTVIMVVKNKFHKKLDARDSESIVKDAVKNKIALKSM